MKKVVGVVLSLSIVISTLAGCGSSAAVTEESAAEVSGEASVESASAAEESSVEEAVQEASAEVNEGVVEQKTNAAGFVIKSQDGYYTEFEIPEELAPYFEMTPGEVDENGNSLNPDELWNECGDSNLVRWALRQSHPILDTSTYDCAVISDLNINNADGSVTHYAYGFVEEKYVFFWDSFDNDKAYYWDRTASQDIFADSVEGTKYYDKENDLFVLYFPNEDLIAYLIADQYQDMSGISSYLYNISDCELYKDTVAEN